jgi:hypothetical protein
VYDPDPIRPGTCFHIFEGLPVRFPVYFDRINYDFSIPLGRHQGQQAGTGTDIQHAGSAVHFRPCPQYAGVGAYFHGRAVLPDPELLELKKGIGHRHSKGNARTNKMAPERFFSNPKVLIFVKGNM